MKNSYMNLIIYIVIIISVILMQIIIPMYMPNYTRLFNLMIWSSIFLIAQLIKTEKQRYNNSNDKNIYVGLVLIGYYIIYFSLGMIYDYKNNPYSQKVLAIIQNIIYIIFVKLFQEFTRYKLIYNNKGKINYIITTILLIIVCIDFNNIFINLKTTETVIEYIFGELLPICMSSILLTYLNLKGGLKLACIYVIIKELGILILPILPDLNWFIKCVLELVTTLIIFLVVYYFNNYRDRKMKKRDIKKLNPINSIPIIIFLTLITAFVAGLLPYKPVAVMSNSMYPVFSRGDIIIIKKVNENEIKQLEEGTIIEYKVSTGSSIVHRIINIDYYDNEYIYTTKGDNNVSADTDKVKENQIKGIVKYTIPYIGFPSVLFSQYVLNVNPIVNTY